MTFEIVRSAPQYEAFAALALEHENDLPAVLRHDESAEELRSPETTFGEPNAAFIATVEGRSAGCAALFHHDSRTAILARLYVSPEYRNKGVGRKLVTAIIGDAIRRGYDRLTLDTEPTQLSDAYRLYRSMGFEECEPYAPMHYDGAVCMQLLLVGPQELPPKP